MRHALFESTLTCNICSFVCFFTPNFQNYLGLLLMQVSEDNPSKLQTTLSENGLQRKIKFNIILSLVFITQ